MGLLADFRLAAVARHRFPDDQRLDVASLFSLVRDMPLAAEDADSAVALEEWSASQWLKHALLHQLYREFGLNSVLIYAAHEISPAVWPWLPRELASELESDPLPDVHSFLRLQIGSEWMALDATWPAPAAALGIHVNDRFEAGRDMKLACDPDELFHVPDDVDLRAYYDALLERMTGNDAERRQRFFRRLVDWLGQEAAI